MWQKILFIILLFYIFALLQGSFFTHFNLFGAAPNLVFILFFLLVFFIKKDRSYQIIYLAAIAGVLLDISSYTYLGPSIIILMAAGFLLKKTQSLLKNRQDNYPFAYFLPLFVLFFTVYEVSLIVYLRFFDPSHALISFDLKFIIGVIYNSIVASVLFLIYKKWLKTTG
jgi:rod shape-determining protein MreD